MLNIDIFKRSKVPAIEKPKVMGQNPPLKLKEIWAIRMALKNKLAGDEIKQKLAKRQTYP